MLGDVCAHFCLITRSSLIVGGTGIGGGTSLVVLVELASRFDGLLEACSEVGGAVVASNTSRNSVNFFLHKSLAMFSLLTAAAAAVTAEWI